MDAAAVSVSVSGEGGGWKVVHLAAGACGVVSLRVAGSGCGSLS